MVNLCSKRKKRREKKLGLESERVSSGATTSAGFLLESWGVWFRRNRSCVEGSYIELMPALSGPSIPCMGPTHFFFQDQLQVRPAVDTISDNTEYCFPR